MMSMRKMLASLRRRGLTQGELQEQIRAEQERLSRSVCRADIMEAVAKVQSSVGKADLAKYEKWQGEYGAT